MAGSMFAPRPDPTSSAGGADSLLAFESEAGPRPSRPPSHAAPRLPIIEEPPAREAAQSKLLLVAAAIVAGVALAVLGLNYARAQVDGAVAPPPRNAGAPGAHPTGIVNINSRPDGALVMIDGISYGVTPLKLSLPVGNHTLVLQSGGTRRSTPISVDTAVAISQYVDLGPAVAAPASPQAVGTIQAIATGRLEVITDPNGVPVKVDGIARGTSPLVIASIAVGAHTVVMGEDDVAVSRPVRVVSGATATVFAAVVPPGAAAGWVSVKAPIELQMMEAGRLIGTTSADRVMLPVGRHELDLVSQAYGFQTLAVVQVIAGRTVTPTISLPNGSLSINAAPWAEVFVDGKSVGTTPLGNLSVTIGSHDIVWKHPTLGEKSKSVVVTTQAPVRVSIDFSK